MGHPAEGCLTLLTPDLRLPASELWANQCLLLKSPSQWSCVRAALVNK